MKIAHISDLHFGVIDDNVLAALSASLREAEPDLVIASGDITQSALSAEFTAAQAFFRGLGVPVFSVPGNHDLPGMDLMRFVNPFGRYKYYIAHDLNPVFHSDLIDIKGLNSARMILPHWNWANGAVSAGQRRDIGRTFAEGVGKWRMVVLHHPPMNSRDFPLDVSLDGAAAFFDTLREQRVDLVLAGHQHHAYLESRESNNHTCLFLNASTATSTRIRRQPNGFNMLHVVPDSLRIDLLRYENGAFAIFEALTHTKAPEIASVADQTGLLKKTDTRR
jgi:3',5'-cyclic AMP phosphodiesterase CpdA